MIRKHNEVYFEYNSKIEKLKEIVMDSLKNNKLKDFIKEDIFAYIDKQVSTSINSIFEEVE